MKKDRQEQLARESPQQDGYSSYGSPSPSSPFRSTTGMGYTGHHSSYGRGSTAYYRGGYTHGRGAHPGHHPYQRPALTRGARKFKNKSVTFVPEALIGKMSDSEGSPARASTTDRALPEQAELQHNELQTQCPAFTMTGTKKRDAPRLFPPPGFLTTV
jgi:hypothetical protein